MMWRTTTNITTSPVQWKWHTGTTSSITTRITPDKRSLQYQGRTPWAILKAMYPEMSKLSPFGILVLHRPVFRGVYRHQVNHEGLTMHWHRASWAMEFPGMDFYGIDDR